MNKWSWSILLMCLSVSSQAQSVPSVRLSNDGTYLIDSSAQPVFLNGDSAWSLMVEPTDLEILNYLDDRASKGYNALIVNLIDHLFGANAPANIMGDAPFTGAPFSSPNEAYFARADRILNEASKRGITVFLAPAYLGYAATVCPPS